MPATLSDEDKAFVRAILNSPADLTGWLAYADWLDERDDPRAEYVRLQFVLAQPENERAPPFDLLQRLAQLQAKLDPYWIAIFDRPAIENCDKVFAFKCPKKWEYLKGTEDPLVRDCDACQKKVYYCHGMEEAYQHARQNRCVAISLSVAHVHGDVHRPALQPLNRSRVMMGRIVAPTHPREAAGSRPWWKFW